MIPPGWHYPEITCARIQYEKKYHKTENFKKTEWCQLADIKVAGKKVGSVEVYYLKEMPELDETLVYDPATKKKRVFADTGSFLRGCIRISSKKWQTEKTVRIKNNETTNELERKRTKINRKNS